MPEKTTIRSFVDRKNETINKFSNELEQSIADVQKKLSRAVISKFANKLERNGVNILNSIKNKQLVSLLDGVYNDLIATNGQNIIDSIINGVDGLTKINRDYYKQQTTSEKLNKAARLVRSELAEMLGIDGNGKVVKNGYLSNLLEDKNVIAKIKNYARRSILTQQNANKFADGFERYINGYTNGKVQKQGLLQQFYKETAFDTIAQADRITSTVYSNELGLVFALYEGGLVPNSRKFCRDKNGKVFHISEILAWKINEAVPPNYNPIIDLGGYGCRHHLNWISTELALRLRPDAKKFLK